MKWQCTVFISITFTYETVKALTVRVGTSIPKRIDVSIRNMLCLVKPGLFCPANFFSKLSFLEWPLGWRLSKVLYCAEKASKGIVIKCTEILRRICYREIDFDTWDGERKIVLLNVIHCFTSWGWEKSGIIVCALSQYCRRPESNNFCILYFSVYNSHTSKFACVTYTQSYMYMPWLDIRHEKKALKKKYSLDRAKNLSNKIYMYRFR